MARLDHDVPRWRSVGHVTLTVLLVAIASLAGSPVARAAAAAARLSVTSTWETGFIARFTVVNSSSAPMSDWRLEFDLPEGASVSRAWSSSVSRSGTHYVITPANWNRVIAPGSSTNGGMRGVLNGSYSPPVNCVLNGQIPCS